MTAAPYNRFPATSTTRRLAEQCDVPLIHAWTLGATGVADYFVGSFRAASENFERAAAILRDQCTGAAWELDSIRNYLLFSLAYQGRMAELSTRVPQLVAEAEDRGDLDAAAGFYAEGLAASRENGDRYGAARGLMLLGEVERKRGASGAARAFYEEALVLARAVGSVYVAGLLEGNLAYLAASCGRTREATAHARAALAACRETGSWTVGLPVLVAMAEVRVGSGDTERALELLGFVLRHPGNRQDHRMEVERVLARIRRENPAVNVENGLSAGPLRAFWDLAEETLRVAG